LNKRFLLDLAEDWQQRCSSGFGAIAGCVFESLRNAGA
jgi:hypothetical protein